MIANNRFPKWNKTNKFLTFNFKITFKRLKIQIKCFYFVSINEQSV